MTRVQAVDFGNVILVEVRNSVTLNTSTSNEAIDYFSSVFRKPAYLVSKVSNSQVRYRGHNQATLNQLRRINPYNLRWATYNIS